MRPFLLLLLLILVGPLAHAQDLLTKRSGDVLAVKVVEITPSEVCYRRADNPDGPLIRVWRSEVLLIRYANGTTEPLNAAPARTPAAVAPPVPVAAPAAAQPALAPPPVTSPALGADLPVVNNQSPDDAVLDQAVTLDGPRVGVTILTGGILDKARESVPGLNPVITQFGWQFETRLFRMPSGLSALAEFVPLVGGLDQGKFIPSISGLLGMRTGKGFEVGIGPNVTPVGTNLVVAVGASFRSNGVNFPVNLAVVPGNGGARISLLFGFNARHR